MHWRLIAETDDEVVAEGVMVLADTRVESVMLPVADGLTVARKLT